MTREQIEISKEVFDKLEYVEKLLSKVNNENFSVGAAFMKKFKPDFVAWLESMKYKLEKELEKL